MSDLLTNPEDYAKKLRAAGWNYQHRAALKKELESLHCGGAYISDTIKHLKNLSFQNILKWD